jgi:hypothetical protein
MHSADAENNQIYATLNSDAGDYNFTHWFKLH